MNDQPSATIFNAIRKKMAKIYGILEFGMKRGHHLERFNWLVYSEGKLKV